MMGRKPFAYLYIHWRATSTNNAVASREVPPPVMADACAWHSIKLADNKLTYRSKTSRGRTVRTVPPRED